ncbi:hypothetical protein FHU13_001842 [Methylobacterium sp. R2-1]|nr:hypothetical protein [Methylobacterium sp. R2-1]
MAARRMAHENHSREVQVAGSCLFSGVVQNGAHVLIDELASIAAPRRADQDGLEAVLRALVDLHGRLARSRKGGSPPT